MERREYAEEAESSGGVFAKRKVWRHAEKGQSKRDAGTQARVRIKGVPKGRSASLIARKKEKGSI